MKRIMSLLLALLVVSLIFAGCKKTVSTVNDTTNAADTDVTVQNTTEAPTQETTESSGEIKTIGDIDENASPVVTSIAWTYVRILYSIGDDYYCAHADFPREKYDAWKALDDENSEEADKILEALPITGTAYYGAHMSDEELNALVGKTGLELLDAGWIGRGNRDLEKNELNMQYQYLAYVVTFDGETDGTDISIKDLKVTSVSASQPADTDSAFVGKTGILVKDMTVSIDMIKTMGDAFKYISYTIMRVNEKNVRCLFELDGACYAVSAEMPEAAYAAYEALDEDDALFVTDAENLFAELPIDKTVKIDGPLSRNELFALAGKTGQDLLNDGWTIGSSSDDDELIMEYGVIDYFVLFDGAVDATEDSIKDKTVKSVEQSSCNYGEFDSYFDE